MKHLENAIEVMIPKGIDGIGNLPEGHAVQFIRLDKKNHTVSFQIQDGPIKEVGVNGCQVTNMLVYVKELFSSLNRDFPCDQNEETLYHLQVAINHQETVKIGRTDSDVFPDKFGSNGIIFHHPIDGNGKVIVPKKDVRDLKFEYPLTEEEAFKKEEVLPGYMDGGLKRKYIVRKYDDTPISPEADYFVLRLDKDPHAQKAILHYAASVRKDNPELADDIEKKMIDNYGWEKINSLS